MPFSRMEFCIEYKKKIIIQFLPLLWYSIFQSDWIPEKWKEFLIWSVRWDKDKIIIKYIGRELIFLALHFFMDSIVQKTIRREERCFYPLFRFLFFSRIFRIWLKCVRKEGLYLLNMCRYSTSIYICLSFIPL